jgi:hypothetical protein
MNRQEVVNYYSRREIAEEIVKNASGREVAGAFSDGSYDSRPNIIQYSSDVIEMAKKGITSFHYSVEHWKNPMAINIDNYNTLRSGWDLIIDIDSKIGIEGAQVAALKICEFLEKYSIKNYGIKFSGSRGFHMCLASVMFPKEIDYKPIESLYPETPRIITEFIREKIAVDLLKELLKNEKARKIKEVAEEAEISPYLFVDIEKGWGNRHMFRAPYSFNEKTWLVSVPLDLGELKNFSSNMASHEKIKIKNAFFKGEENEAESLLLDAWDLHAMRKKEIVKKKKPVKSYEKKIPEELFPPCMKIILSGLQEGRKRSTFSLINFLRIMNWKWPEIEEKVIDWNNKNKPPLPENFIIGQLKWAEQNLRNPANCPPEGDLYYTSTGVCHPDNICKNFTKTIQIKNPIAYPFKKMRLDKSKPVKETMLYSCSVCKKKFPKMNSLHIHQSRMHGIYNE